MSLRRSSHEKIRDVQLSDCRQGSNHSEMVIFAWKIISILGTPLKLNLVRLSEFVFAARPS